jgi:hypothetical protein
MSHNIYDRSSIGPFFRNIAGIFLFILFSVLTYFNFFEIYHQILLLNKGVIVDAALRGVETKIGRKKTTRYVRYKMSDDNIYSRQVSDKQFHKAYIIYKKSSNKTIKVFTLPNDPSVNAVNVSYWAALKAAGVFLFSLGLSIFAFKAVTPGNS